MLQFINDVGLNSHQTREAISWFVCPLKLSYHYGRRIYVNGVGSAELMTAKATATHLVNAFLRSKRENASALNYRNYTLIPTYFVPSRVPASRPINFWKNVRLSEIKRRVHVGLGSRRKGPMCFRQKKKKWDHDFNLQVTVFYI